MTATTGRFYIVPREKLINADSGFNYIELASGICGRVAIAVVGNLNGGFCHGAFPVDRAGRLIAGRDKRRQEIAHGPNQGLRRKLASNLCQQAPISPKYT